MLDEDIVRSVTLPDKENGQATCCYIMEQQEGQQDAGLMYLSLGPPES